MNNESDKFEEILKIVGHGKFQRRFNFVFNLVFNTLVTAPYFNIVIALTIPDHWCNIPSTISYNFSSTTNGHKENQPKCTMNETSTGKEVECPNGWIYDQTWFKSTIPSDQDWVCSKELYVTYALMCSSIGEVVGMLFFGQLGDRIGRRPVFLLCVTTLLIGRMACSFSTSIYPLFMAMVFLGSFASSSVFQCPLIIAMEMTSEDGRATVSLLQAVGWNLAFCIMPLIYWYDGHWFIFMMVTTAPLVIVLAFQKWLTESPRWLATMGKSEECIRILKKIAKCNGTVVTREVTDLVHKMQTANNPSTINNGESLFSSRILIKRTILIVVTWIASNFLYNIYFLNTSYIGGNPFLNYIWLALAELPGNFLAKYLCNRFGRRLTRFGTFFLASVGSFVITFFIGNSEYDLVVTVMSGFVKFNTSMIYYVLSLHTLELYPTPLRQTGMAMSTITSGILGICSPYIIYLGQSIDTRIPYILCACLGAIGLLAIIPVPETLYSVLPETIKDAENLGKGQSFWSIPKKIR